MHTCIKQSLNKAVQDWENMFTCRSAWEMRVKEFLVLLNKTIKQIELFSHSPLTMY